MCSLNAEEWGPLLDSTSNKPDSVSNKDSLFWASEMEEVGERPPWILMIDNYFTVYKQRRRTLISGSAPIGLSGNQPPQARIWQVYQNRMSEEPAWERAERYRRMMQEQSSQSIRALARATGGDHSRMAKILHVLELPERVLAALRAHTNDARIRAHFTEKRLWQIVRQNQSETVTLCEIEQVIQGDV